MVGKSLHAGINRLITLSIRKKDRPVQINLSPSDRLQRMLKFRIGETRRTRRRKPRLSSQVSDLTRREDLPINRDGYSRPCGVLYADWSLLMSRVSIPFREPALEGSQSLRP